MGHAPARVPEFQTQFEDIGVKLRERTADEEVWHWGLRDLGQRNAAGQAARARAASLACEL